MSSNEPVGKITYESTMKLARQALYLWPGAAHDQKKAEFLLEVAAWISGSKKNDIANLTPEQAADLYQMMKRLGGTNDAAQFFQLLNPAQSELSTKRKIPQNAQGILDAVQREKGVFLRDPKDAFNQAVWDHLNSNFPKTNLNPTAEERGAQDTIFIMACQYSSPQMIEKIYKTFFGDLEEKPVLHAKQSPISGLNVAGAIVIRHVNGEQPLTRNWEGKLIEMGALKADSIKDVIPLLIGYVKKRADGSKEAIHPDRILSVIEYWKSTEPKAKGEALAEWLELALREGRVDVAKALVADPDLPKATREDLQTKFREYITSNQPEMAMKFLQVYGNQVIDDNTLFLAYQKIDPMNPALIQELQKSGAQILPDQVSPLLINLCISNAIPQVRALLNDGIVRYVGGEKHSEKLAPSLLNDAFHQVLGSHQSFEGDQMGMLLELRKHGAVVPAGKAISPENKRIIQACDYVLAFGGMDKKTFLTNLETYANQKLGSGLNAKVKQQAILSMIKVLRNDNNAQMPDMLLRPIAIGPRINIVPNANKLFPKGGLLGKNNICLLDAMDYNRNPLAAKRRLEKYEETSTMKVMKQQAPANLRQEVLNSLDKILRRLEKELGNIRELDLNDPGKLKYDRLESIRKAINDGQVNVTSLEGILKKKFNYTDKKEGAFTLLDALNIQRSQRFPRAESTSLKMFMKDLHVKDVVKEWKSHLTQPSEQTSKPGRGRSPK